MDESIMKSNKFVAFTLMLFVLLISISAISAADLNDTDNTAENVLKEDNVKSSTFLDLWADVGISESKTRSRYRLQVQQDNRCEL